MNYLKSLFSNFLAVFFANYLLPGVDVIDQTKLPHLGADLPFALLLGLLNSLVYPVLKLLKKPSTPLRIAAIVFGLNLVAYAVLMFLPIGIEIASWEGHFLAAGAVSLSGFLTNYFDLKRDALLPIPAPDEIPLSSSSSSLGGAP